MYTYNDKLLDNLSEELGLQYKDMAKELGVPLITLASWRKRKNLKVSKLVDLCNVFRISISSFICEEGNEPQHIIRTKNFQPIEFRFHDMGNDLSVGKSRTIEETVAALDVGLISFYRWFRYEHSVIMLDDFLKLCNQNLIYPGDYIVDYNCNIPKLEGFIPHYQTLSEKLDIAHQRIQDLKKKNRILLAKIEKIESMLKDQLPKDILAELVES